MGRARNQFSGYLSGSGRSSNQVLELPQPENIGATQQEPTREEHDQGDQPPELPTPLEEPRPEEPKVPAGSQDPQVEVDEVKGSEVQTEEYDRECEACHHSHRPHSVQA